jgi:hypothetical protein
MLNKAHNDFFKNELGGSVSKCFWYINSLEENINISPYTFIKSVIGLTSKHLDHLSKSHQLESSSPVCFDDYLNKTNYIADSDKDEIMLLKNIETAIEKIRYADPLNDTDLKNLTQSEGIFNFCKAVLIDKLGTPKIAPKFINEGFSRCEKSYMELISNFVEINGSNKVRG